MASRECAKMKRCRVKGFASRPKLKKGQSFIPASTSLPCIIGLAFVLSTAVPRTAFGYSLLTHEQIIDIAWKDDTQPLLLKRFPKATVEELRKAHAYAYGGWLFLENGHYHIRDRVFICATT